jgi:hypothetical protein
MKELAKMPKFERLLNLIKNSKKKKRKKENLK